MSPRGSDLQRWLREHDPLFDSQELESDEWRRLRGLVVAAERTRGVAESTRHGFLRRSSHLMFAGVATCAIVIMAWVAITHRDPVPVSHDRLDAVTVTHPIRTPVGSLGIRHQLHFETPGGTKIIWVLDASRAGEKETQ